MSAQEAMRTSKTTKNSSDGLMAHPLTHCVIVFLLDVLLVYFLEPPNPLLALLLATILWHITWEDYRCQTIDIRWCGALFMVGLLCRGSHPLFYLYVGLIGFFIPHILHELFAKIEQPSEKQEQGSIHFVTEDSGLDENEAPAYVPLFVGALFVVLLYYLLALPMPKMAELAIFAPAVFADMPQIPELWLIPLALAAISIGLHFRAKQIMKKGCNIVYRGFGDGDIYFFGAMIGVFGFILTILCVFLSLFPAFFVNRRWRNSQKKEGRTC